MSKKQKSAFQQSKELYQQSEKIKSDYTKALELAKKEVTALQAEIVSGEEALRETYKNYVLNIISLEAYQAEEKALNDKKDILHVAQKKVADIDQLMKEELAAIADQTKAISAEYRAELNSLIYRKRMKLLELKRDYLQAIIDESKDIIDAEYHYTWANELDLFLGRPARDYVDYIVPENLLDSHMSMGAEVSREQVIEAYKNRAIDYKLLDALNK